MVCCLAATPAWAQEPPTPRPVPGLWTTTSDAAPAIRESGPPLSAYPAELLGLLAPPAERGPLTLTPSIALSAEYNDNVFLDNQRRQSDVIGRFSPGLTLTVNRPAYQVTAGYTVSGELYATESELTDFAKSHALVATGLYRGRRGLTLTVAESFALSRNTNQVGAEGFSSGQRETWSNTVTPGLTWEATRRTSLNLGGTFGVFRSLDAESDSGEATAGAGSTSAGSDSNTYRVHGGVDYTLTRRLTGTAAYEVTYLDFLGEQGNSTTHNPSLGFRYLLTPTLTASASAGPALTQLPGETTLSWAGSARLLQVLQVGSISLEYTRTVSAAGGLGGTSHVQAIAGSLVLPGWERGLVVAFTPRYSVATSVSSRQTSQVDVKALSIPLLVSYQIARYTSVFAEYTFFQQRSGGEASTQGDVDQNRLRFGIQFGYPFNFD
jgi:hypothetical protein